MLSLNSSSKLAKQVDDHQSFKEDEPCDKKLKEIYDTERKLDQVIEDMGTRIHTNMKNKEQEYLEIQSIFVKRKEVELRALVDKLQARKVNNLAQDEIILNLRTTIQSLHQEKVKKDNELTELNKKLS